MSGQQIQVWLVHILKDSLSQKWLNPKDAWFCQKKDCCLEHLDNKISGFSLLSWDSECSAIRWPTCCPKLMGTRHRVAWDISPMDFSSKSSWQRGGRWSRRKLHHWSADPFAKLTVIIGKPQNGLTFVYCTLDLLCFNPVLGLVVTPNFTTFQLAIVFDLPVGHG